MSKKHSRVALITLTLGVGIVIGTVLTASFNFTGSGHASGTIVFGSSKPIPDDLLNGSGSSHIFKTISKEITPAVVSIRRIKKMSRSAFDFLLGDPGDHTERGLGSGVVVSDQGYIITNNHVISDADQLEVVLTDKRVFRANIVGTDPLTDIAMIKINATNLTVARIGNSDQLEVGEWVLAVGNPMMLNSTVTAGIVSALGRNNIMPDNSGYSVEYFIQTDAVINPGNSGGALVNVKGEVVGINTAIATSTGFYQGYGFAVPINIVREVMEDIIKYGKVVRGYVGVEIRNLDAVDAKALGFELIQGIWIDGIVPGGAAEGAGLRSGDVVLAVDGRATNETNELQSYVLQRDPGEEVTLRIFRSGKEMTFKVKLKGRDGETDSPDLVDLDKHSNQNGEPLVGIGFDVTPISDEYSESANFNYGKGVVVRNPKTRAQERNVFEGLILVGIGDSPVHSLADYQNAISNLSDGQAVILHLLDPKRNPSEARFFTSIEFFR